MELIVPRPGENPMDLLKRCRAVYVCPKVGSERKGPLVAYAGKDSKGKNYVGDIYINLAYAETYPEVAWRFALAMNQRLRNQGLIDAFDTVCGIPNGGRTFGQMLALVVGKRFTYADKKPILTEAGKKQEYTWDLSRFEFKQSESVAVVDDVFNNFQNTDHTLTQIAATGAKVTLLIGAFNRSPIYDTVYTPKEGPLAGQNLPILAAIRKEFPEYEQDDPEVASDIAKGNLELEVKKNWAKLLAIMDQYP